MKKLANLDLEFQSGDILEAISLTTIVNKINEVIDNIPVVTNPSLNSSSDTQNGGVTEQQVEDKIAEATSELNARILTINNWISQLPEGSHTIRTEEEMIDLFKSPCAALLFQYGLVNAGNEPYFDIFLQQFGVTTASISGYMKDNLSNIGIKADKIIIDGQTLVDKLSAIDVTTKNLTVEDIANITQAVITNLETSNITVKGTLNYTQLIGNVVTVDASTNWVIPKNATYVKIGNFSDTSKIIRLPNPNEINVGHTIFVESRAGASVLPTSGTEALLGGWVYDHTNEIETVVGFGDREYYYEYIYRWDLVEYNSTPKDYNLYGNYNLYGAALHTYMWTGDRWVETTSFGKIEGKSDSNKSPQNIIIIR